MAFLGMRGTGDWGNERPENWRQKLLQQDPNGTAALTAITSMMGSETTDDYHYHWFSQAFPSMGGTVTGVYTDVALSSAYAGSGVADDVVYVKAAASVVKEFAPGHQVILQDASDPDVDVVGKVVSRHENGANSYVAVKLLEADDNSDNGNDLQDCDTIRIAGSINPQGGESREAVNEEATEYDNYTQIFRTSLDITGTAEATKLRIGDAYQLEKREKLKKHGREMEMAWIHGIPTSNTGTNDQPETTTAGILYWIKTYASNNVFNYKFDSTYSGASWLTSGETWFDNSLEVVFRYGEQEKMAIAGSGAILGLNRLAKSSGQIQLRPMSASYGLKVMEWITPFGTIYLKTHPLFSYYSSTRNRILVLEPKNIKYRPMKGRDTKFRKDIGNKKKDGREDEWLTEAGMEFHFPNTCGIFDGVGIDNAV